MRAALIAIIAIATLAACASDTADPAHAGRSPTGTPLVRQDAQSGLTYFVDKDNVYVIAIDQTGKVRWRVEPRPAMYGRHWTIADLRGPETHPTLSPNRALLWAGYGSGLFGLDPAKGAVVTAIND